MSFQVVRLAGKEDYTWHNHDHEAAVVPLSGSAAINTGDEFFEVSRKSVFTEMGSVLYAPPGSSITITARTSFEFAIGWAPAEGRYPLRMIEPSEVKTEVRGGGAATRQVNHLLAHPLPAERLILYEVYVPRGMWSGWPPHCHDGFDDSPYLEETYYFETDPADGFCVHRNWRIDEDFDETFIARNGDLVLVPKGYHSSAAAPGNHMYFLNFLAGELVGDDRKTPPCFLENYTWIEDDWDAGNWTLPVVGP